MNLSAFAPAAMAAAINWTEVATVVISGVGIVLGVLLVLILVFYAFGAVVSKSESLAKRRKAKKTEKAQVQAETAAPAAVQESAPQAAPAVQQGTEQPGELIAVITAAVAAQEQSGNFVIKSIKKRNARQSNAWARAAVIDNTKSF